MKKVFVLFAADMDSGEYDLDVHAIASTRELAEKIGEKDQSDGQIREGWIVSSMAFYEKEEDI